jgi:hypothetical protein
MLTVVSATLIYVTTSWFQFTQNYETHVVFYPTIAECQIIANKINSMKQVESAECVEHTE